MSGSTCPGSTDVPDPVWNVRPNGEWLHGVSLVANARGLRRVHARRVEALGRRLADEVAWNILLDLVVSEEEGRSLSVTALAVGAQAPLTTVLRYVEMLGSAGYVERVVDRKDRRRSLVRLTLRGREVTGALLTNR